jgi:3-oxoadipate enol-lactonase
MTTEAFICRHKRHFIGKVVPGMPRAKVEETLELYYERYGRGHPVVFVNGLTASLESWYHQVPSFSKKYSVIIYDCRGQGRSDKPPSGYTGDHHTRDLKSLLNSLGIPRIHLIGHSFGGFVAMNFAINYPDMVGALVISDSTSEAKPLIEKILNGWVEAQRHGGLDLRFDVSLPWLYSDLFIRKNPKKIRLFKEAFMKNSSEATERLTIESLNNRATERLGQISSPTLLLLGDEDVLTPMRYAQQLKEKIAGAQIAVIEKSGHVPPIENHPEFNRVILKFLEAHDHLMPGRP